MKLIHFLSPKHMEQALDALDKAGFEPCTTYVSQTRQHPCGHIIYGENVDSMHLFLVQRQIRNNGVYNWEV